VKRVFAVLLFLLAVLPAKADGSVTLWRDHTVVVSWRSFHVGDGKFNWDKLDRMLYERRPAHLIVLNATPEADLTPPFVSSRMPLIVPPFGRFATASHIFEACGRKWYVSRYDDYIWRRFYRQMVEALAERYDGSELLDSVVISIGLDGEPQLVKTIGGCHPTVPISGLEHAFGKFVEELILFYAEKWKHTQVYVQVAVGGAWRARLAQLAIENGLGVKHAGLTEDFLGWASSGLTGDGSFDGVYLAQGKVPICLETKHGMGSLEQKREIVLAGLGMNPSRMILHNEYGELGSEFLEWVEAHVEGLPTVWASYREVRSDPRCWTGYNKIRRCVDYRQGYDNQGLEVTKQQDGFLFTVKQDYFYPSYRVSVTWYDKESWRFQYGTESYEVLSHGSGELVTSVFENVPGQFFLEGPVQWDFVEVEGMKEAPPLTPTPSPTPTPTPTPSPVCAPCVEEVQALRGCLFKLFGGELWDVLIMVVPRQP